MTRFTILAAIVAALSAIGPAWADTDMPLIAQACAGCHGQDGAGQGPIATIAGYDRDEFLAVWAQFRADERPATIMNRIARGYTEDEVAALADYFASLR